MKSNPFNFQVNHLTALAEKELNVLNNQSSTKVRTLSTVTKHSPGDSMFQD